MQNATPIPPKSAEQTKAILMQFPVSSGQHHRANEGEWVPVVPTKPHKKDKEEQQQRPAITIIPSTSAANTENKTVPPEPPVLPTTGEHCISISPKSPFFIILSINSIDYGYNPALMDFQTPQPVAPPAVKPNVHTLQTVQPVPILPPVTEPVSVPPPQPVDNIFADTSTGKNLDVSAIITTRLSAMRKLQDNPLDTEALKSMYNTQKDVRAQIISLSIFSFN